MPLYEYECSSCGARFERIRKFSDPPLEVCPECGAGPVRKLVSSPAFQFKGTGWYATDYAKKSGGTHAGDPSSSSEKGTKHEKSDKKDHVMDAGSSSDSTSKDAGSHDSSSKESSKDASSKDSPAKDSTSAPASPTTAKKEP